MTVALQRTLVALVVVGGEGASRLRVRVPPSKVAGFCVLRLWASSAFPVLVCAFFVSSLQKLRARSCGFRFVRKDVALPRLRFVRKRCKKGNRSGGSKIWFGHCV
uniref:Uncharacterized protein n=1 Tax=Ixodes scapularis TaxID=6945 RepID=A0A4D5S2X5_IXOSC